MVAINNNVYDELSDHVESLFGSVPKNLTLHRIKKYFFLFTIWKRRSVAVQPCMYNTQGCLWGQIGSTKYFLQKSSLKTLWENTLWQIHFGKIHLEKILFVMLSHLLIIMNMANTQWQNLGQCECITMLQYWEINKLGAEQLKTNQGKYFLEKHTLEKYTLIKNLLPFLLLYTAHNLWNFGCRAITINGIW